MFFVWFGRNFSVWLCRFSFGFWHWFEITQFTGYVRFWDRFSRLFVRCLSWLQFDGFWDCVLAWDNSVCGLGVDKELRHSQVISLVIPVRSLFEKCLYNLCVFFCWYLLFYQVGIYPSFCFLLLSNITALSFFLNATDLKIENMLLGFPEHSALLSPQFVSTPLLCC